MARNKINKTKKGLLFSLENNSRWEGFWDFWGPLLLTIGIYAGIRTYIAEARYIPSGSMLPGLQIKDRLLIEKLTFRRRLPRRGEIVVFKSPYSFNSELVSRRSEKLPSSTMCAVLSFPLVSSLIGFRDPACDAYIKRIVAVGGDQVLINKKGEVFINGVLVKEPYVSDYCSLDSNGYSSCVPLNTVVPFSQLLVLGDNRRNSWDSRFWPGSPFLPEKQILGRAVFRFWPINRIGILGH